MRADYFADGASGFLLTIVECLAVQGIPLMLLIGWSVIRTTTPTSLILCGFGFLPAFFGLDSIAFQLTGQHFTSARFLEIASEVPIGIVQFISPGVLLPIAVCLGSLAVCGCLLWLLEKRLARHWHINHRWDIKYLRATTALWLAAICIAVLVFAWTSGDLIARRFDETATRWKSEPTRHPLIALGWLATPTPIAESSDAEPPLAFSARQLNPAIDQRISQMRMNVIVSSTAPGDGPLDTRPPQITRSPNIAHPEKTTQHPDVLIIIAESLRSELLDPAIMPNVHGLTQNGLWLRQHYSGGNASSLGVFSIVSGLEAAWFYKSEVRFAPPMNRLFRQAGYELGFFASTDDWATFQMDAFLSDRQYDVFQDEPFTGLDADQRAIESARQFLNTQANRPPRLAVLCLYGTHAPFWSDKRLATDQPAASDTYPIPFPASLRTEVWNRYRNAARTLDASLAKLVNHPKHSSGSTSTRGRVIVFTGDHGESFAEDGTIGHGLKLSQVQTQTAAVIASLQDPNQPASKHSVPHAEIRSPTSHADILPTLLSACGLKISMPGLLDGTDLTNRQFDAPSNFLQQRPISIAGYVGKEILILAPHHSGARAHDRFGLRCRCSLVEGEVSVKNWVNLDGSPHASNPHASYPHAPKDPSDRTHANELLRQWISRIGLVSEGPDEFSP